MTTITSTLGATYPPAMPAARSTAAADAAKPWAFYDETTATDAIVAAIDGAHQVVNAEFFGLTDAGKGARVVEALKRAARRGVEVNVITDFLSSVVPPFGSYQRMRRVLEGAGARVIMTSRILGSPRARQTPALKHVDHRKVVTIDGSKAFVGGMNFIPLTDAYQDTMVSLSGVAAARLAANQLDRWTKVGGARSQLHVQSVTDALKGASITTTKPRDLRIVTNSPDTGDFELTRSYVNLIRSAKRRLWIASPVISDRKIAAEIAAAARRGVDVRLITSIEAPLLPAVGWITDAHLADIVAAGGKAYQVPGTIHRKALIADDETILSSFNLSDRSAQHDHELGIRTQDPSFVAAIAATLQEDFDNSTPFAPSSRSRVGALIGDAFTKYLSY